MGIRRTKHAVYDLKYYLVWILKYRKHILGKEVLDYLKATFNMIAEEYKFRVDTMEVTGNHVHIFVEVPPKYSLARVVQIMKSISARETSKEFPNVGEQLWGRELRNDGYFVCSVGDKITAGTIQRYIEYQTHEDDSIQLNMFDIS